MPSSTSPGRANDSPIDWQEADLSPMGFEQLPGVMSMNRQDFELRA